jgi:hypothetical protein
LGLQVRADWQSTKTADALHPLIANLRRCATRSGDVAPMVLSPQRDSVRDRADEALVSLEPLLERPTLGHITSHRLDDGLCLLVLLQTMPPGDPGQETRTGSRSGKTRTVRARRSNHADESPMSAWPVSAPLLDKTSWQAEAPPIAAAGPLRSPYASGPRMATTIAVAALGGGFSELAALQGVHQL